MKSVLLFLMFAFIGPLSAQQFAYLGKINLEKNGDFKGNQANVIKATDYLLSTPMNLQSSDRIQCTRFLLKYAIGCPDYTLEIKPVVLRVSDKNSQLSALYVGLWLKSAFANAQATAKENDLNAFTEIYKYADNKSNYVIRTPYIEALLKAGHDNKVAEWLMTEAK
jgi:hypothetical protein